MIMKKKKKLPLVEYIVLCDRLCGTVSHAQWKYGKGMLVRSCQGMGKAVIEKGHICRLHNCNRDKANKERLS